MKILLTILLAVAGSFAQAEMLDGAKNSPYHQLKNASEAERAELITQFKKWVETSGYSETEKKALEALITEDPSVTGDGILEVLDQEIISWFYGYEAEKLSDITHNAKRLSSTPNESNCKQHRLCVVVDKSRQRLNAYEYGRPISALSDVLVSTARKGKHTPTGLFSVQEIAGKNRYSGIYKGAYLGYAMQIHGNIFLHATSTNNYKYLGSRASAGCIRMTLEKAQHLNRLMREIGRKNIRVVVKN